MPAERYFLERAFGLDQIEELEGAEFHHLARTMRTKEGERVELVNGKGSLAEASVITILRHKALLNIERLIQEPLHVPRLVLAQALPKPNRLEFILEKGTELGVDAFWLFPGVRSMKKDLSDRQLERARALTIAAMKQCGRLTLPEISLFPFLERWPKLENGILFFGDVSLTAPLLADAWSLGMKSAPQNIFFFTGPEGGFHPEEEEVLKKQGATGVRLHANILRTDTASLAALSLLSHGVSKFHSLRSESDPLTSP